VVIDNVTISRLYGVRVANTRRSWKRVIGKWWYEEACIRKAEGARAL